ncbi:hypothetical protein [Atopococcus tabaci]|uniref:hypothetical protein n=1 Tax=Atopococcus tabaci TaxID=269774 RepID=UPI0004061214|nr:hypothetical protein [Atopococcus tabaci]
MKKITLVWSAALGLSGMLVMEKEVNVENEWNNLYIGVEENKQEHTVQPLGVWLPGDLEDEVLP